ncbi:serine/threonine-protein kinase [Streptomyces sp. NPDC047009]|uniref:serine/threonine-protein kinase n=1 Tax=Streptomyces sp. NPDC047009 TaxID=3154496 RepID=UPI0033D00CE0
MGTVYAAVGERGERVAVKVVHAGQVADEQFRARFRRGVQVLARVSGPCLVPLLDADPEAETPWLATAYVPGLTLSQHAAAHGPLAGIRLHLFAAGTARALAAVHAAGVVHRDLKPANVILAPDGPRVLDFGIAHVADGTAVTRSGMLTGTPGWLSPEYYRDGSAGPPGDVFAWGALLAFAATGRHPFGTGTAEAVAFRVLNGEPDLAGVPNELNALLPRQSPGPPPACRGRRGEDHRTAWRAGDPSPRRVLRPAHRGPETARRAVAPPNRRRPGLAHYHDTPSQQARLSHRCGGRSVRRVSNGHLVRAGPWPCPRARQPAPRRRPLSDPPLPPHRRPPARPSAVPPTLPRRRPLRPPLPRPCGLRRRRWSR